MIEMANDIVDVLKLTEASVNTPKVIVVSRDHAQVGSLDF